MGQIKTHARFSSRPRAWLMKDFLVTLDQWCRKMEVDGFSEKTIKAYRRAVGNFHIDMGLEPQEVTEAHVTTYLVGMGGQGPHRNLVSLGLKHFFGYCSGRGIIEVNPTLDISVKRHKYTLDKKFLTPKQIDDVVQAAAQKGARRSATIRLAYGTGARVGSLCAIRPTDVDVEAKKMDLLVAKGSKPYTVPLGATAFPAVLELLQMYDPMQGPYLVGVKDRTVWAWCKEAGLDAGVTQRVHPHLLRHSYATHLIQRGANIEVVRQLMNHQSLAVTQQYVAATEEDRSEAVALI